MVGISPLILKIQAGDLVAVRSLLQTQPELAQTVDELRRTGLHLAACLGFDEIAETLINQSPELVDAIDNFQQTPLHMAAARGSVKIVQAIIARNPKTISFAAQPGMSTPILIAVHANHEEVLEVMLACSPMSREQHGFVLHQAIVVGNEGATRRLLAHDPASVDVRDSTGRTALHLAVSQGNERIVQMLIERRPELVGVLDPSQLSALHLGVMCGRDKAVEMLCARDPRCLEVAHPSGWSVLHFAVSMGSEHMARVLVAHMSPQMLGALDHTRRTALHMAAEAGQLGMVQLLLERDAGLAGVGDASPLHLATARGHTQVVRALATANPQAAALKDYAGRTALHAAVESQELAVLEALVAGLGAEAATIARIVSQRGHTAFDTAITIRFKAAVELLFAFHLDQVHAVNNAGDTLLHRVARFCPVQFVERVWRMHKAALDAVNKEQHTPLREAILSSNTPVIFLFQARGSFEDIRREFKSCARDPTEHIKASIEREVARPLGQWVNRDVVGLMCAYLGADQLES